MHPIGAFITGGVGRRFFVTMFQVSTNNGRSTTCWVSGTARTVRPVGRIACGIFGLKMLGGVGGVTFASQLVGSVGGAAFGFVAGTIVYGVVDRVFGFRMSPDEERRGADLSIQRLAPIQKTTFEWDVFDPLVSSAESALMSGD